MKPFEVRNSAATRPHDSNIPADLESMIDLRPGDREATAELQRLLKVQAPVQSGCGPSCESSSASCSKSTASCSQSSAKSNVLQPEDLPFKLHAVDRTRVKVGNTTRTWLVRDMTPEDPYIYPVWDSYDIRIA